MAAGLRNLRNPGGCESCHFSLSITFLSATTLRLLDPQLVGGRGIAFRHVRMQDHVISEQARADKPTNTAAHTARKTQAMSANTTQSCISNMTWFAVIASCCLSKPRLQWQSDMWDMPVYENLRKQNINYEELVGRAS